MKRHHFWHLLVGMLVLTLYGTPTDAQASDASKTSSEAYQTVDARYKAYERMVESGKKPRRMVLSIPNDVTPSERTQLETRQHALLQTIQPQTNRLSSQEKTALLGSGIGFVTLLITALSLQKWRK